MIYFVFDRFKAKEMLKNLKKLFNKLMSYLIVFWFIITVINRINKF